ncbi:M14 family metallopeptidase [Caldithrix abyssi]
MRNRLSLMLIFILFLQMGIINGHSGDIPNPASFFGFQPGEDRQLFDYEQLIAYLKEVAQASDRIKMVEVGRTPFNKPIMVVFISNPQNIANLDRLKKINHELALNWRLQEAEQRAYIAEGKVFVLGTLSMHSGEVGPSQAAPLIVYHLATTQDAQKLEVLKNVVYMMVPSQNPDGMDMVVHHYWRYKGTKYEGSSLPGVYHKYVGHDNNRDYVILSQKDTRAIARLYNKTWLPQVVVEKHQMGATGPRYFVPPMHDPIAENVDAAIWNWSWIFGSNMVKDMTAAGLAGVTQHYLFDDYWPGSTETSNWKNCISLLTECASCQYATPVYVEPTELSVYGKGLAEYKKSINMSLPWEGGWWRLSDIVRYEIESTLSLLKTASLHRAEILKMRNDLCKKEVRRGREEAPYYFLFSRKQHDLSELVGMVRLLIEHNIQVFQLTRNVEFGEIQARAGDIIVPLSQPFRPFVKEVLEAQIYPLRHYTPGGEIIKPYDITSWSLPLHRGISCKQIDVFVPLDSKALSAVDSSFSLFSQSREPFKYAVFNVNNNESFKAAFQALKNGHRVFRLKQNFTLNNRTLPAGSFVLDRKAEKSVENLLTVAPLFTSGEINRQMLTEVKLPRIALMETYFHDMDAGWTRFVLDQYGIAFEVIRPGEVEKTKLSAKFDLIIFPDVSKDILMEGKYKSGKNYYMSSLPPEFARGMGKKGFQKILKFLDSGGKIIAWGRSTELFMGLLTIEKGKNKKESFQLPVKNIAGDLQKKGLYIPGSLLRMKVLADHPLTYGLPSEIGVFSRGRPVFKTSIPRFDMKRRVIGFFPERKILMSGYAEKEKLLGNKAAAVWIKKNKGQLFLLSFRPQFRASTQGSFKLLFNALLLE